MSKQPFVTISNEQIYQAIIRIDKKIGNVKSRVKVNSAVLAIVVAVVVAIVSRII